MSGAVKAVTGHVKKMTTDLISDPKKVFLDPRYHLDPGEFFAEPDTSANMSADETIAELEEDVIPETEQATIAETAALTAKKKKKETTQTILTSPLGSTQTAKTAVAKLGGY